MRKQIFSIAVTAALAIPAMASAHVEMQTIAEDKVLVSYDLKELSTAKGRADLERHIRLAADQVCGPRTVREAGSFAQSRLNRKCFNNAIAEAMKSVASSTGNIAAVSAK